VSRDSIVDGDWLPATEWCQRYLPCCQPACDVSEKFGSMFRVRTVLATDDFELIQTVERKTRNLVEGYFGSEFPAIYNHWGVTAAWSRKTLKMFDTFLRFFWKKNSPDSAAVATARIANKICQGQPPTIYSECSRFHPNRFTLSGVVAERVNTAKTRHKLNPIFGWSLASSRIITNYITITRVFQACF